MLDVLVVDDSDLVRSMILKTLRLAAVPVGAAFEASNGREALGILDEQWIDLVIADINMPVMDGVQMVERMRDSRALAGIPVVVVSSEGATSRTAQLRSLGVVAYVRKPFTPEALRAAIVGLTSRWRCDEYAELLEDVVRTVLERFTFMYGEPVDKGELPETEDDLLAARITFRGALEGTMGLAAPRGLCLEMAANALGEDSVTGSDTEGAADALGEVLNMACGHVASALEADRPTDVTPPTVARLAREDWGQMLAGSRTIAYVVEGRPMLVSLGVREAALPA